MPRASASIIATAGRACLSLGGLLLGLAACGPRGGAREGVSPAPAPAGTATATPSADRPVILCLGTSLTAGYGLDDPDLAWPALVQTKVDAAGLGYRVVNAGVSGETSAGARRRLDWLLRQRPAVLVLETGANDALRGQDPAATRENVEAILERVEHLSPPPRVLLLGMKAPPNLGRTYTERFEAVYPELARAHHAALVPFVLQGIAGIPRLNQPDGIHPTAEGHAIMADTIWSALRPLIR